MYNNTLPVDTLTKLVAAYIVLVLGQIGESAMFQETAGRAGELCPGNSGSLFGEVRAFGMRIKEIVALITDISTYSETIS